MKRRMLSGALIAVLGTVAAISPAISANPKGAPQGGSVYKFKQSGIQFTVPAGWEVDSDPNGTVTFSKKEAADSFIIAAISTLPAESSSLSLEQQFNAAWEGAFSSSKDYKDFRKIGDAGKATQNGMPLISQAFTAVQNDLQMIGVLAVVKADKPTLIFIYGTAKTSKEFDTDFGKLMDSMKKIE